MKGKENKMTTDEFNQHVQEADAVTASEPSDGLRRLQQEIEQTERDVFSFEAIRDRLNRWNAAYHATREAGEGR